jgi:membrane protease YdiL (CAAX protease family)
VVFTQLPGGFIAAILMFVVMALNPGMYTPEMLNDKAALLQSGPMSAVLAVTFAITEVFVVGLSWLVIRLVVGRDWPRSLALRRPSLVHFLLVLASVPGLVLLANGAYYVLRNVLHVPSISDLGLPGMEEMGGVFANWPWQLAVLVIGLGPGLGEELWCRGFLGRGLVGRYGAWVGIILTSFYFGLIHIDPCQGAMAMLMGFFLHFVYLTTRSFWMPVLLHFLNNSLAVITPRVQGLQLVEQEPSEIPLYLFAAAALLIAGIGWALYRSRVRLAAADGVSPPPWRPAYPSVEYPPPDSGTVVVRPLPDVRSALLAVAGIAAFVVACYFAVTRA